jgi:hypothetical protein
MSESDSIFKTSLSTSDQKADDTYVFRRNKHKGQRRSLSRLFIDFDATEISLPLSSLVKLTFRMFRCVSFVVSMELAACIRLVYATDFGYPVDIQ